MLHQGIIANECQILQLQVPISHIFFLGLLVLPNNIRIGNADLEIDGVGDWIMQSLDLC